jgi:hypothetical protein
MVNQSFSYVIAEVLTDFTSKIVCPDVSCA